MKKLLKILAIVFGVLVILIGAVIAFLPLDKIVNEQKDKFLPEVERMLGRKVNVGEVRTTILPVLGAEIRDVAVLGRTPEDDPLMKMDRLIFRVDLWTALKSFGQEVRLNALIVDGLGVNLVREADGTLSYQDVLDRLAAGPPAEEEAPKPMDPEVQRMIENMHLKRIALENGQFQLIDKATGGEPAVTYIKDLLVELDDVILSSPFELHVAAAVFSDARNFDFRTRIGPIPIGNPDAPPPPVEWITIKADAIALGGLAPYLPKGTPARIDAAKFGADLRVDDPMAKGGRIKVAGDVSLEQIAVGKKPGKPFDLKVSPNVYFDPKAGVLDVNGFSLALDDMVLSASGKIEGLNEVPSFQDLKVKTERFDVGRLFAMFPDAAAGLPPNAVVDGPFVIDVTASGDPNAQDIKLAVNLDGTRIFMPGGLDKPAGTPLNTQLDAGLSRKDLDLRSLKVTVGDLVLALSGTVKNFDSPTIAIQGGTGKFDINGPVRLLPDVRASIPPDVKVAGQAEIDIDVKGGAENIDAKVVLGIYGADLAVPGTTVRGSGKIDLAARGNPAANLAVKLDAGLSGLDIKAGGMNKDPGVPFEIKVDVTKAGQMVNLGELLVHFGPIKLVGSGTANQATGVLDVKVDLARFSVADLAKLLPELKDNPFAASQLGMKLAFSGDPNQASTVKATMDDFFFALKSSSLTGKLSVENLDAPKIRFAFNSPNLDLDEMFPPSDAEEAPADEGPGGEPPPIVKAIDAAGDLTIAKGRAGGMAFTKFIASLVMKNGVLTFNKLDFDAYEGHFTAAQTSVDIGSAVPAFDVRADLKNVNANTLLAEQANAPGTLSGRLAMKIGVKGRGKEWEQISKVLTGHVGAGLSNGKFHKADVQKAVIDPLSKKLPFVKLPGGPGGTNLKDLQGEFRIADGKAQLEKPMVANTPEGPITFDGYIGLDKALNLKGTMMLEPSAIQAATAGKLKPGKAMPVGMTLGGTVDDPKITGVEVGELAELLAKEFAKQMGAEQLLAAQRAAEEAKAQAEAMARKQLDDAKAKADAAKAQAQAQADAAKARAEAEKRKAQEEAERRKKEAEAKAKKEAEDRAKGALRGRF